MSPELRSAPTIATMSKSRRPSSGREGRKNTEENDVETTAEDEGSNTRTTVPTDLTITESTFSSSDYSNATQASKYCRNNAKKQNVRFQDDVKVRDEPKKGRRDLKSFTDFTDKYSHHYASSQFEKEPHHVQVPVHQGEHRKSNSNNSNSSRSRSKHVEHDHVLEIRKSVKHRETLEAKYFELLNEINQMELTQMTKLTNLESELKLKSFESKRVTKLLHEAYANLKKISVEKDNAEKQIKVLTEQLSDLKSNSERKICDLTMDLHEKSAKLSTYEKIQAKIDKILFPDFTCVDNPAESTDDTDIDRIIHTYGFSGNIPIDSKVRLQQSLDLAKRLANERDRLEKSRDEAQNKLREVEKKHQDLLIELNQLKLTDKRQVSEFESELKFKKFEVERLSALFAEMERSHKTTLLDRERLAEKLDILKEELFTMQNDSNRKITALTLQLQEKGYRLETYDRLEAELDKVVIQAAALPNNESADEILAAYGYGASIPSNAKRRLEQSLRLARRVLQLEQRATEQKDELFKVRDQNQLLKQELDATKSALMHSGHPTTELINVVTKRNIEIGKLNEKIKGLELRLEQTTKSNFQLQEELTKVQNNKLDSKSSSNVECNFRSVDSGRFSSQPLTATQQQMRYRASIPCRNHNSSGQIQRELARMVHIKNPLSFSKLTRQSE